VTEGTLVEKEKAIIPTLDAVLVIIVTFVLVIFLGAGLTLTVDTGLALILSELLILIVPLTYMLVKRINIRSYIGLDVKPKFILIGLASGLAVLLIDIAISGALTAIFGVSQAVEEANEIITSLSASPSGLAAVIIALSLAGVCEEFAFRAFLQNAINRRYSFIPAVIASSVAFGVFHFDPQLVYILAAIIVALALGYIYHRYNSYLVAAIAHSTVNLIVLATLLLAI
jgi:membrane protease YdiL (CAAX protease family)